LIDAIGSKECVSSLPYGVVQDITKRKKFAHAFFIVFNDC